MADATIAPQTILIRCGAISLGAFKSRHVPPIGTKLRIITNASPMEWIDTTIDYYELTIWSGTESSGGLTAQVTIRANYPGGQDVDR